MIVQHADWTRCKPWIEASLSRTPFFGIEDAEKGIEAGEYHFWPSKHGAALTEFIDYPKGKALNIFAVGGESNQSLDAFLDEFEPCLQTWGKTAGCRWIIGFARDGWGPSAAKLGYRKVWTSFAKELV